jgi:hypothetical protein
LSFRAPAFGARNLLQGFVIPSAALSREESPSARGRHIQSITITDHQPKKVAPMKAATPWITYRTRFLVKAKQLTSSLTFTDILGRQHSGRKGDYLVESSEGVLRIFSRQIFEDVYVPLPPEQAMPPDQATLLAAKTSHRPMLLRRERTSLQCDNSAFIPCDTPPLDGIPNRRKASRDLPAELVRKSPQPSIDRRVPTLGIRSL